MELIKINNDSLNSVNARELHTFLAVGRDFSNWIKARIQKYGFVENQDFIVVANSGENLLGGRPSLDYHVSIDMAKHLSMVENNDQGRKARTYFIECEKKLRQLPQMSELQILHAVTGEMCKLKDEVVSISISHFELKDEVAKLKKSFKTIEYKPLKAERALTPISTVSTHDSVRGFANYTGVTLSGREAQGVGQSLAARLKREGLPQLTIPTSDSSQQTIKVYPKEWILEELKDRGKI